MTEEYYSFLDNSRVGISYDWTSFNIDLNFNKNEIDLDSIFNGSTLFIGNDKERLFIHEYVHFLQNFYTNWGGLMFSDFVLGLNKLAASRGEDDSEIVLPLKLEKKDSETWNDGVEKIKKFEARLSTDNGNIQFENTFSYPQYKVTELNVNKLVISNGRIIYTINSKTIREHMAELSSCLFIDLNDNSIHERFLACRSFSSSQGVMDREPMYWFLFEYFFANKYINIAEGLVKLTHAAMCSANPTDVICRFFVFIRDYKKQINSSDLILFVNAFLILPIEIISFSYSHHASLKNIADFLKLCQKYKDQSFYQFAEKIYFALLINISQTHSAKKFFENPGSLRIKNNWLEIIKHTGTPIIRYKDKTPVISQKNDELIKALTYFLGTVKVFHNLQTATNQRCPFFEEFNICKSEYKNPEMCYNDALKVKNPLKNGKECLYQNAIELLGLKDRLI